MGAHEIRSLGVTDWAVWREIRLRSLADAPEAFGSKLTDWQGPNDREDRWRSRFDSVAFNAVVGWAASERVERVVLAVRRGNAPAVAFYTRSGFVRIGPNPDDTAEDLMTRQLEASEA